MRRTTVTNPNGSCEVVVRKAPKPHDDKGENKTQSPSQDNQQS
jgi:hypothetical protein